MTGSRKVSIMIKFPKYKLLLLKAKAGIILYFSNLGYTSSGTTEKTKKVTRSVSLLQDGLYHMQNDTFVAGVNRK